MNIESTPAPSAATNSSPRPLTMQERQDLGKARLAEEIERARAKYHILMVPKDNVPEGAQPVECWETATEFIIIGTPSACEDEKDPGYHNCDEMGCSSLCHVVARFPKVVNFERYP